MHAIIRFEAHSDFYHVTYSFASFEYAVRYVRQGGPDALSKWVLSYIPRYRDLRGLDVPQIDEMAREVWDSLRAVVERTDPPIFAIMHNESQLMREVRHAGQASKAVTQDSAGQHGGPAGEAVRDVVQDELACV